MAQGSNPCKSGSFSQEEIIPVGQTPVSVSVADFDNDGRQDLVLPGSGLAGLAGYKRRRSKKVIAT